MKNLTTSKSILIGFGLIALSIATLPYSSKIVKPAFAVSNNVVIDYIIGNRDRILSKLTNIEKNMLSEHNQLYATIKDSCK